MATLENTYRDVMLQAFIDTLDASGTSLAYLSFEPSGSASALALCYMSSPAAFASSSAGVSSANAVADSTAAAAGTLDHVCFRTGGAAKVLTATIATASAEFAINGLVLTTADTVQVTAITLTMPAS